MSVDTTYDIKLGIEKARKEEGYTCYFEKEGSKKYIWSKYEPQKSAKQLISFEEANKETIWIVFGLGLGYIVQEILNKSRECARVIVVEPTWELVDAQKEYIVSLLEDGRVKLFCGEDMVEFEKVLAQTVTALDNNNIRVTIQPIYREIFTEYYSDIFQVIQNYLSELQVNIHTKTTFSEVNLTNLLLNKEKIKKSKDITGYHNKYKDIPAVIVSAGPSLNKNIHYLKDFKGVIFTGGRTLPHVMKQGVSPHFLVSIDPTEISYDTLREGKNNNYNLICTEVTNQYIVNQNTGNQYFVRGTASRLSRELLGVNLPTLPMYGSVATLCLSSAYYMGCNPIIFIGQDLAYTGLKAHVDEYKSYKVGENQEQIHYVLDINGNPIPTGTSLLLFLKWIERFIQDTQSKVEYINCTEGGAHIQGTSAKIFKEVIEQYSQDYSIQYVEENLFNLDEQKYIEEMVEKTTTELKEIQKIAQRGAVLSQELKKEYVSNKVTDQYKIDKILKELDKKIDKRLKQSNKLAQDIFLKEYATIASRLEYKEPFEETLNQKNIRIVSMSYNVYKNIYDATSKALELIENI